MRTASSTTNPHLPPSMKIWTPNQPIGDGKYLIQQVLGSGGFGVTYSATEQRTGKLVAIKTLNPIQQTKPDFPQRQVKFLNEALTLAKCHHPYIVQVYEMVEDEGLWGMVMEYIQGEDLANYVDEHGIFSEESALPIMQQIGEALTFVHERGFLHRDIKPNNIVRRSNNQPVLIDFGLAREFTQGKIQSMTNQMTEYFAPIEQYERNGEFGAYTDVYALAATLYTLLTGEFPFPAKIRQQNIPLVEPKQHQPGKISDRVNQAIIKGMALEPHARPQSVQSWLELLMPQPAADDVKLISAVGMDYTRLREMLAAGKWREADEETARVMLAVAGREKERYLDSESIEKFPCPDLRTLDQLWVKYSQGHFGFSVQKRIWLDCGGKVDVDTGKKLGDRVGWRGGSWKGSGDITYSLKAPQGHLPGWLGGYSLVELRYDEIGVWLGWFFSRVQSCSM